MNQVLNVRMVNNDVLGSVDDAAGTPTVIGLLKQTYNKLNLSAGNTNLNLTLLQNKVTSLENTVNGSEITNPPIEGLTARVSDLEDVTDDQSDAIRRNGDNISDLSTSLTNLSTSINTSINTINGNINTINGNLTTLTNRITAVDKIDPNDVAHGRLKVVEDQVDHLEINVADLVAEVEGTDGVLDDITNIQADIGIINGDLTTINGNLTTLTNRITAVDKIDSAIVNPNHGRLKIVEDEINTLDTAVQNINGNINTINGNVNTLDTAVQNINGNINTINGNINTINGNLTTLTNRITAVDKIDSAIVNPNHGRLKIVEDEVQNIQTDISNLQSTVNGLHAGVGESTNNLGGERFNLYSNGNPVRNDASGSYSHAEGYLTIASGDYSHVEGASNTSSGESSHAEGQQTQATGQYTHTEGYLTQATFKCAHAEGSNTIARANYSHAGGEGTVAGGRCMTAIGRFNTNDDNNVSYNRFFVVGNGLQDDNRSDAFVVKNSGEVIINSTRANTTPSLRIGNSRAITGTTALWYTPQQAEDDIIITKHYAHNDLMTAFMNITYPVDSIYFSHNVIDLYDDQGNLSSTGKPLAPTSSPLDFGTWYRINWDCDNYYCIGLKPQSATTSGAMTGDKKLSISHLPAHAHMGIWTPDGARPSGTGGTACVPANTTSGNNARLNATAVIPNSLGDSANGSSYTNYAPSTSQSPLQPYGYYCYMYRKVSLS